MNEKFPVENFILKNGLKLAWFSTSSAIIKGFIGTRIETEEHLTLDVSDCEIFCLNNKKSPLNKEKINLTINIKDIQAWGLD